MSRPEMKLTARELDWAWTIVRTRGRAFYSKLLDATAARNFESIPHVALLDMIIRHS